MNLFLFLMADLTDDYCIIATRKKSRAFELHFQEYGWMYNANVLCYAYAASTNHLWSF